MEVEGLAAASRHRFADWPNPDVPNWRSGVYGVWLDGEFIYVGMAGRGLAANAHLAEPALSSTKAKGLRDRLNSHASGRRSGDQFCVYVCDRLVVPSLTPEQLKAVGEGTLFLDTMTRDFVRSHLQYAYILTESGGHALLLERDLQRQGLGGKRPRLNPG